MKNWIRKNKTLCLISIIVFLLLIIFIFLYSLGFRITYDPGLDNNWDAVSAFADWAGVIVGAIIIPIAVAWLQHKWDINKNDIALSNLVTVDQLNDFERKIAPLLKEKEQGEFSFHTVKPNSSLREQQLLQFLSISMGASIQEIAEHMGLSQVSTHHLISKMIEDGKIEVYGFGRNRIYKVIK